MAYSTTKDFLTEAAHGSPIWRLLASAGILIGLSLFYWAFGLPPFSASGFAHAEDVDRKVETKVQAAIAPVIAEQQKQAATLGSIQAQLRRQQIFDLQKTILAAKKEQCTAKREGRSIGYWSEQLQKLRQDYIDLTGSQPDIPGCGEV